MRIFTGEGANNAVPRRGAGPNAAPEKFPPMVKLLPGDAINKVFVIERELGEGGMGTVYLATHRHLRRKTALKIPRSDLLLDGDARARLEREACLMARLCHENIVAIHDMRWEEEEGEPAFIALEYVEGSTLTRFLRDLPPGAIELRDALGLFHQIANALDYLHLEGVVHRDLKPANILVEDINRRVKLLDFGLARPIASGDNLFRTEFGGATGTPGYMAPEQTVAGHDASPAMDIYAFGVLLYKALARSLPWDGRGMDLVRAQVGAQPIPLHHRNPRLPPSLSTTLAECFGSPRRRPASAKRVFLSALRELGPQMLERPYDEVVPRSLEPGFADDPLAPDEPTELQGAKSHSASNPPTFNERTVGDAFDKLFG